MTAGPGPVPVSSLREPPVTARFKFPLIARSMAPVLQRRGASASPIRAGRVGGALYVVNDFEAVDALRIAGIESAMVSVQEYGSMGELLAEHVECNLLPHAVDALKVRQVVDYMVREEGATPDDACRALALDARPDLAGCVHAPLADAARDVYMAMAEEIASRVSNVAVPAYYVTKVAKVAPNHQEKAAKEISRYTLPRLKEDGTAAWPAPDALDGILSGYPRSRKDVPVEERVSEPGDVDDLPKKRSKGDKEGAAKKAASKAACYIESDPNLLYVPLDGSHPDLIVNTKTKRVAVAKESGGAYTMTDDLGRPTYALGQSVTRYLGVESADAEGSLTVARYPSIKKAREALAGAKDPGTRCVVISTCPLPRR